MRFIAGKLLKTISYRVDKEIQGSLYRNTEFLKSRWGRIEKNIVRWSINYKKYSILTFFLALLVFVALIFLKPWLKPFIVEYLPYWRKLLEWQKGFLSGQLTIVGVVYPLVVGLISILFQNKSAQKTIFPIYQKYSGFMFAGLSGLALSCFIMLGYFLRAHLSDTTYAAFCITSAVWLTSNILLTAWFFTQTFRMLEEYSRNRLILRFSIHESCEFDIRERIQQYLIQDAITQNLLINPDKDVLRVLAYKYSDNDYEKLTRTVDCDKDVRNIRYRLINIAIRLQIFILKTQKVEGGTIVIQPLRSGRSSKNIIVAQYNGFTINPIVKLLIKGAFSFKEKKVGIGISAILNGIVGPARDALRDGNTKDFSDAVKHIAEWHAEIARALSFKNDQGNEDNWLLLSPSSFFPGLSYLSELLNEYYRLARDTVEKIPENSSFYRDMLYLHLRVFADRDKLVNQEAGLLIQYSYYFWPLLMEWRSYSSDSGDMRIANKYEDILYDFVGAWEHWLMLIEPRSKRSGDIERTHTSFLAHLKHTALTAIAALRFNNYEAAGWGVDMLNNWFNKFSQGDWPAEYYWRAILLNPYFLLKDSNDPAWIPILNDNEYNHLAAFNLAFKNASLDLRILTACYMLLKPDQTQTELLVEYVKILLSGELVHETGATNWSQYSISNAGEVFGVYIRHRDYSNYGYGNWLSSVLDSFGSINRERWVSGRIYSGWGANRPRDMHKAYVEIAISLSTGEWKLPHDWEEAIWSDAFSHDNREQIVADLRDWLKIAEEERSYLLFDKETADELIPKFCASITKIVNKIEKAQDEIILETEIDQERLKQFGIACSEVFRNTGSPPFPLSLFKEIKPEETINQNLSYGFNITNYAKKDIALGVDTNRTAGEEESFGHSVSDDVRTNVLIKILQYPHSASYKYTSVDNILSDINNLANTMPCPVLFVGSQKLSTALRRASHNSEFADNYAISRRDGFGDAYICHIGRCEAYGIQFRDVDYCLLTTKEIFYQIRVLPIADDQFVKVSFIPDGDNKRIGKLQFQYTMDVEFADNVDFIKLELDIDGKG